MGHTEAHSDAGGPLTTDIVQARPRFRANNSSYESPFESADRGDRFCASDCKPCRLKTDKRLRAMQVRSLTIVGLHRALRRAPNEESRDCAA